jgi:hypothetical protein
LRGRYRSFKLSVAQGIPEQIPYTPILRMMITTNQPDLVFHSKSGCLAHPPPSIEVLLTIQPQMANYVIARHVKDSWAYCQAFLRVEPCPLGTPTRFPGGCHATVELSLSRLKSPTSSQPLGKGEPSNPSSWTSNLLMEPLSCCELCSTRLLACQVPNYGPGWL